MSQKGGLLPFPAELWMAEIRALADVPVGLLSGSPLRKASNRFTAGTQSAGFQPQEMQLAPLQRSYPTRD
jgi:hypothetical protein